MDAAVAIRDAEVRALGVLGQELPDAVGRLVRLAMRMTGTRHAELNLLTGHAQHTIASAGGPTGTIDIRHSSCVRVLGEAADHYLTTAAQQDRVVGESWMASSGQITTYAAQKLVSSNGVPVGTICVYDEGIVAMDPEQLAWLREVGQTIMELLETIDVHEETRSSLDEMTSGSRELRRSNDALAAFAGQVAHDVQNPLAGVLLSLQLLEQESLRAGGRPAEPLVLALKGAQRMRETVSGLMDFAVVGGRLDLAPIGMDEVVADVLEDLTGALVDAEVHVAPLPAVLGDHVQLRLVVQNLVTNAVKYAGEHPHVTIAGESREDRVRITVSDDGPGVTVGDNVAIFTSGFRGEAAARTATGGLGIGLATCRRIITAHGGTMGVEASATGGAAFWFELPAPV